MGLERSKRSTERLEERCFLVTLAVLSVSHGWQVCIEPGFALSVIVQSTAITCMMLQVLSADGNTFGSKQKLTPCVSDIW